jgi:hypothetical protein
MESNVHGESGQVPAQSRTRSTLELTMSTPTISTDRVWVLPPLILHPVSEPSAQDKLAQGSRARLVLNGLLPDEGLPKEEWIRRLLDCRYCEVRILFYLGKDLARWTEQCAEIAGRDFELRSAGVREASFARLLVQDPPQALVDKMVHWGVPDCRAAFRQAQGLSVLFRSLPVQEVLAGEFLSHYRRYAEAVYEASQQDNGCTVIENLNFRFEMYASAEYVRLLEAQWGTAVQE